MKISELLETATAGATSSGDVPSVPTTRKSRKKNPNALDDNEVGLFGQKLIKR